MSSEPIVGVKGDNSRAPDAPDTSDDDGSQPEHGKKDEAADPKLDQAEEAEAQKAESGRRSSQSVATGAQDDVIIIIRQIEEMEQNEKYVKAGPCFTQLAGSVGNVNEKVGERKRPSTSRVASKASASTTVREAAAGNAAGRAASCPSRSFVRGICPYF